MASRLSTGLVKKLADTGSLRSILNGGKLLIFPGPQRADADLAAGVTPLITITGLAFSTGAPAGVMSSSADISGAVSVAGTAGWYTICESADDGVSATTANARWDGAVGTSGAQLNLPSLAFALLAPFLVPAGTATLSLPKS